MPPSSCGLVVIWLAQLETKIRKPSNHKRKRPWPTLQPRTLQELKLYCTYGLQSAPPRTVGNLHMPHIHTWKPSCSFSWDLSTNLRGKENEITSYLTKGHNSTHLRVSSTGLLPRYSRREIPKCFPSEPLLWASLTLSYGLYSHFKEKLLSNTWILKHLFSFWIPVPKAVRITIADPGFGKQSQTHTQKPNKLSKSWVWGWRRGRKPQTKLAGDPALGMPV